MIRKRFYSLLCIMGIVIFLGGCGTIKTASDMDTDDWKNWRIGTPLAWSPDYYLTGENVQNFYRYDSASDCIMALKFGYVDAIALDSLYANEVLSEYPEFEMLEEPIGDDALVAYVTSGREDLLEQINEYIPNFRSGEIYDDLYVRANADEFIPNTDIPVCEAGKVIRVAIAVAGSSYPYTYYDFGSGEPQGVDIEFIKNFAAEYGYSIEWVDGSWDSGVIGVSNGTVDIFVCAVSEYFVEETERTGVCLCTDTYFDLDLVLLIRSDEE